MADTANNADAMRNAIRRVKECADGLEGEERLYVVIPRGVLIALLEAAGDAEGAAWQRNYILTGQE